MTNNFMGRSQINECPHKTVSRFYDSAAVSLWRCDWCGQEFRAVDGANKMVELHETATPSPDESPVRASVSRFADGAVLDSGPGSDSTSQVEALPDRGAAP